MQTTVNYNNVYMNSKTVVLVSSSEKHELTIIVIKDVFQIFGLLLVEHFRYFVSIDLIGEPAINKTLQTFNQMTRSHSRLATKASNELAMIT